MRRPSCLLLCLLAGLLAACSAEGTSDEPAPRASIEDWRWAPRQEPPEPPPVPEEPKKRRKPAQTPPAQTPPAQQPAEEIPEPPPLPEPSDDEAITRAEVLDNGVALPPLESPPEIRAIIEAGNQIARTPYKWGGGHGKWQDTGYDCSGSVSYALAAAGLLNGPLASGPLMQWGKPGRGKWLTIYSNPGHVFMVVAGVRFDTSAANRGKTGSRFTNEMRPTGGYVARHWPGL
ncbi:MAG: C40 family peptidase [Actinomycetota bacterium]|nr:C40 family peptidase [Actinomycetota bacterium]